MRWHSINPQLFRQCSFSIPLLYIAIYCTLSVWIITYRSKERLIESSFSHNSPSPTNRSHGAEASCSSPISKGCKLSHLTLDWQHFSERIFGVFLAWTEQMSTLFPNQLHGNTILEGERHCDRLMSRFVNMESIGHISRITCNKATQVSTHFYDRM